MKPLDDGPKAAAPAETAAPAEAAAPAPAAQVEPIDFSQVEIEPLFADLVDFDTFCQVATSGP